MAEKFCGGKKGKRNFGDCKRIFEQAVVEALDVTRDISISFPEPAILGKEREALG